MENREISALQTGLAGHFIKRRLTEFGASAALSDISARIIAECVEFRWNRKSLSPRVAAVGARRN